MNTLEMQSAPGLSNHGAAYKNSDPLITAQSAAGEQDLAPRSTTKASSTQKERRGNQFESLSEFQAYIRKSFIEDSGIAPEVFEACVRFHQDNEFSDGGDVEAPIHEALGWDYIRFGHHANETLYAAFLMNEDGSVWQVIVSLWDEKKQRPYSYLAPKKGGNRAFLPPVPSTIRQLIGKRYGVEVPIDGSFWDWLEYADIPRGATEGGKKALCGISNGYVMTALYGCLCGATGDYTTLVEDLERFATEETTWLIALDRDDKRSAQIAVSSGRRKLKIALGKLGCYTADIIWDSRHGKGLDDLIVNQGSEAFDAAYGQAIAKINKAKRHSSGEQAKSKKKQAYILIKDRWADRLRYNSMLIECELDGEPLDLDTISLRIAIEFDIDLGNDTASQIVQMLAKERTYHPVREYLEQVAIEYPAQDTDSLLLESIAYRYLGTSDPLHNVFLRNTMIAAVARVFDPGCKVDTVCTLQGKQGRQKSKFWESLAVNPFWFDDTIASSSGGDKDERLKLRRFWLLEMAEIEAIFKKKEIASLRGFLTTKIDNVRVPYGRSIQSFKRTSILVASVNPDDFLADPEGHRRFWVTPVMVECIDTSALDLERDRLWAAAVHAYLAGQQWWLTKEQERRNALMNKRYESTDSWQEVIALYLDNHAEVTVTQILSDSLHIEVGRHDKPSQMRVAESLKRLGWAKFPKKVGGKSTLVWREALTEESTLSPLGVNQKLIEVSTTSNPDRSMVIESRLTLEELRCQPGVNQVSTEVSTTSNPGISSLLDSGLTPSEEKSSKFDNEDKNTAISLLGNKNHTPAAFSENSGEINEIGVNLSFPQVQESTSNQGLEVVDTSVDTSNSNNHPQITPELRRAIVKGSRVVIHFPGSTRHGCKGIVLRFKTEYSKQKAVVSVDGFSGSEAILECFVPGNDDMRLELIE